MTKHLTAELEPAVAAEKALLYFTASWCGPCKSFGPIVEKFKNDNPNVIVVKIDVDENREIAQLYNIRSVPTVISLSYGDERGRHTGLTNETKLQTLVA